MTSKNRKAKRHKDAIDNSKQIEEPVKRTPTEKKDVINEEETASVVKNKEIDSWVTSIKNQVEILPQIEEEATEMELIEMEEQKKKEPEAVENQIIRFVNCESILENLHRINLNAELTVTKENK